jgi:hypothetical protein
MGPKNDSPNPAAPPAAKRRGLSKSLAVCALIDREMEPLTEAEIIEVGAWFCAKFGFKLTAKPSAGVNPEDPDI